MGVRENSRRMAPLSPSDVRDNGGRMSPLSRLAWLVTVGVCLITALILLLSGYTGYAGVTLAVGIAALINLV
jgi:hypothetical protein